MIVYVHGTDWVFGDAHAHDRLFRNLGANAAVVFPEYDRSPEARYPTAIEQCYAVAGRDSAANMLDPTRIAVASGSVGGNMAIVVTLLTKRRRNVGFVQQVLFYPVTDAAFNIDSYRRFAEGYFLTRADMRWFWDQYTISEQDRPQITASPLRASTEQLARPPPALVITADATYCAPRAMTARPRCAPRECRPRRCTTAGSSTTS